ncbi:MAG: DNA polymerase III subunit [Candidatus Acididesulfobacter diazotrophicus]|uniref:DNA polymerase III subunit n=1 Tax=Candidatus Acididesulfobacter diazotrophicus TaxID=2597226 RepID=A0A519BLH0_9DELT|nr:MAG: DNA polymerase III subunit [Candidatus Acididesulfobacter diazotrophicus]
MMELPIIAKYNNIYGIMNNYPYGFSKVSGHKSELTFLNNLILKDRIPSGLIFYGQESIGKKFTAFSFASSVLCLDFNSNKLSNKLVKDADYVNNFNNLSIKDECKGEDCLNINNNNNNNFDDSAYRNLSYPCGECPSCVGILNKTSSNIIYIEHEKGLINIEKINSLTKSLSLLPPNNMHRFVIVDDISRMNVSAMNSILKILEEPPEKTVFILIAANLNNILPTIISRCMVVNFKPIREEILFEYAESCFNESSGYDDNTLRAYAKLARGSISNLANLISGNYIKLRNDIFDIFISESFNKKLPFYNYNMSDKFNNILKNYKENGSKNNKIDNKINSKTKKKNIIQSDSPETFIKNNSLNININNNIYQDNNINTNIIIDEGYIFEVMLLILRDILVYLVTKNVKLIYNIDIYEEIKKISQLDNLDKKKLSEMVEITLNHINNLNYNLNKHISLDRYFSEI